MRARDDLCTFLPWHIYCIARVAECQPLGFVGSAQAQAAIRCGRRGRQSPIAHCAGLFPANSGGEGTYIPSRILAPLLAEALQSNFPTFFSARRPWSSRGESNCADNPINHRGSPWRADRLASISGPLIRDTQLAVECRGWPGNSSRITAPRPSCDLLNLLLDTITNSPLFSVVVPQSPRGPFVLCLPLCLCRTDPLARACAVSNERILPHKIQSRPASSWRPPVSRLSPTAFEMSPPVHQRSRGIRRFVWMTGGAVGTAREAMRVYILGTTGGVMALPSRPGFRRQHHGYATDSPMPNFLPRRPLPHLVAQRHRAQRSLPITLVQRTQSLTDHSSPFAPMPLI